MKIKIMSHKELFQNHENNYSCRIVIIICDSNKTIFWLWWDTIWKVYWTKIVTFDDYDSEMIQNKVFKKEIEEWKIKIIDLNIAYEIFNFIESFRKLIQNWEIDEIIVSCVWWKCRSSAVAKAIWKTFWFDVDFIDTTTIISDDFSWLNNNNKNELEKKYLPNDLVFNTMMKISNKFEYMKEPNYFKEFEFRKWKKI